MKIRLGKFRLGKVRVGFLFALAFALVLFLAAMFPGTALTSVAEVVILLFFTIAVISFLIDVAWVWGKRGSSVPMQTTLFRGVFVALVALFSLLLLGVWWSHRQSSRDQRFTPSDQALAWLNIAYDSQPTIHGSDTELGDSLRIYGKGLWFDAAAYKRIKRVIDEAQGAGYRDGGTMLLSGRETLPPRTMLPPSMWTAYRRSSNGLRIGIPSDPLPDLIPPRLLPLGTEKEHTTRFRRLGDYIKEHGWMAGSTTGPPDHRTLQYAIWRTGPDTAEWILADLQGQSHPWYFGLLGLGIQGILLYILLAALAAPAAWYLNRRLVKPVQQVAAASTRLARGKRPEPIVVKGPAELATLAASFNHMSHDLSQAQAAQHHFLMSVSHELKTPLTAIDGYAELLSEGAVAGDQAGPVLQTETARLKRLVGDLLESARAQEEGFSVRKEPVPLPHVADEVARRYERQAREFGVKLVVKRPQEAGGRDKGGPWVRGDEDRLVQVVSNLVENALRCTPKGGEVEITVTATGVLRVRDTGPGLQEEDLPRAFERFYLYERCGEERPLGTGLGLAIVKQLTEAMAGKVAVESQPGLGTVFTVELPTAVAPEDSKQHA